jgi:hypothetical protein
VPAFAAWFGQRRWVAKSKDQHGTTPLQLATKHNAPVAVLELLRAAQSIPLTTQTLAGDTLHLRGWEDAWAAPGANLADALVRENPAALQGVYGDEMEPVLLNPATLELSPAVLFRPLVAVEVEVVGVETPTTLSVRLALEGGTVGYARRKIGVLVGSGDGGDTHAGRLWLVVGAGGGTDKRTRRQPEDGELLQTVGVTGGGGGGGSSGGQASLLYERHRTWKGAFTFAPKYELVPVPDLSSGWVQVEEGEEGGSGGGV